MAIVDPFATFDESPYRTAPQLPLHILVILVNALSKRMPESAPEFVQDSEKKMRDTAIKAAKAMVVRLRESNEVSLTADLMLDNAMDGLFTLLRDGLRGYRAYERPGLDFLLKEPDYQGLLEDAREKARKAGELLIKLFGDGNLDMLKREFPEQAALMTNVINLIDEDQHEPDLLEVSGDELFPLIRRVHQEYLAMVDRRTTADSASKADLKAARHKLQRHIVGYAAMVLQMLDEEKPATLEIVETALRPMITMRVGRSTTTPVPPEDADLIVDPEANLEDVLSEAQAELEQQG
jgi:hypothetical protein